MSDGRKRSRKSKLEVRHAFENEESQELYENTFLQMQKLPKLLESAPKNIDHTYSLPNVSTPPTEMEISVQVEVEEFDETNILEDQTTNFGIYPLNPAKTSIPSIEVNIPQIINISNHIMWSSDNPADQYLGVELKNCWGNVFIAKDTSCPYNLLIQKALQDWVTSMSPQKSTTADSRLFYYQCHMCSKAWWHLSQFYEHIKTHQIDKLYVYHTNEASFNTLISFNSVDGMDKYTFSYIPPEEVCPRCFVRGVYNSHFPFKTCLSCAKSLPSCIFRFHLKVCGPRKVGYDESHTCKICKQTFHAKYILKNHLVNSHSIRSDEPMPYALKVCMHCKKMYHSLVHHLCEASNRRMNGSCIYCMKKFPSRNLSDSHFTIAKKNYPCRICNEKIDIQCEEVEHMIKHTDNYDIAYRCAHVDCPPNLLFSDPRAIKIHRLYDHKLKNSNKRRVFTQQMIMPKKCLKFPSLGSWIGLREKAKAHAQMIEDKSKYQVINENEAIDQDLQKNILKQATAIIMQCTDYEDMLSSFIFQPGISKTPENKNSSKKKSSTKQQPGKGDSSDSDETKLVIDEGLSQDKRDDVTIKDEPEDYNEFDMDELDIEENTIPDEEPSSSEYVSALHKIKEKMKKVDESALVPKIERDDSNESQIDTEGDISQESFVSAGSDVPQSSLKLLAPQEIKVEPPGNSEASDFTKAQQNSVRAQQNSARAQQTSAKAQQNSTQAPQNSVAPQNDGEKPPTYNIVVQMPQNVAMEADTDGVSIKLEPVEIKTEPQNSDAEDYDEIELDVDDCTPLEDILRNVKAELSEPYGLIEATDMQICGNDATEVEEQEKRKKRKLYRCPECGYTGLHKLYKEHRAMYCNLMVRKKTKKDGSVQIKMPCTKCNATFASWKSYIQHFVFHGYEKNQCPSCEKQADLDTLIGHIQEHVKYSYVNLFVIDKNKENNKRRHACKTCHEAVPMEDSFTHWENHLVLRRKEINIPETNNSEDEQFESDSFKSLDPETLDKVLENMVHSLKGKMDSAFKKMALTCFICGHAFVRRHDYKRHLVEHLTGDAISKRAMNPEFALKCQMCGDLFLKPPEYKFHMRKHASLAIYKCELCDKTFSDSSNFAKHKKIHNSMAFVCDICGRKYSAKLSLETHMKMHLTTKPIKCPVCRKMFHTPTSFRKHHRISHEKNKNCFRCNICAAKFQTVKDQWEHKWLAHNIRLQKADCPVCGIKFRKYMDVKIHARDEHGVVLRKRS